MQVVLFEGQKMHLPNGTFFEVVERATDSSGRAGSCALG